MKRIGRMGWLVPAIAAAALLGCGTTDPGIQPEVRNHTDDFNYEVTDVKAFSGTRTYRWQNTGTMATIERATTVTAGGIMLVVKDAAGVEMFNQSLAVNGTVDTGAGTAGLWTIRVSYANATGAVNFRVTMHP